MPLAAAVKDKVALFLSTIEKEDGKLVDVSVFVKDILLFEVPLVLPL